MRIARRGLEIAVVERALHQLQVAGRAQKLGAEIVPQVVKPEADHAGALAQPLPCDLHAGIGEGMSLALHAAVAGALSDIGKHELGMVPLQRPDDFTDRRRDRYRDQLTALAVLTDLPSAPIDLRPAQEAFGEPQPACSSESKERREIVARRRLESLALIADEL